MDLIDSVVKSLRSLANERRERYTELILFCSFTIFSRASCLFFCSLFSGSITRVFIVSVNHVAQKEIKALITESFPRKISGKRVAGGT